jgi:hypothetical protein
VVPHLFSAAYQACDEDQRILALFSAVCDLIVGSSIFSPLESSHEKYF